MRRSRTYRTHVNGAREVIDVTEYETRQRRYDDANGRWVYPELATCGTCNRTWDDGLSTGVTPAPSGRCPFEYEHDYADA